jgi:LPS-assembly protein
MGYVIKYLNLLILSLVLASTFVFAAGNSEWDCNLAEDGETWDCSTSIDKVQATQKKLTKTPSATVATKPESKPTTPTNTPETTISGIPSTIPRVRLTQEITSKPAVEKTTEIVKAKTAGDWNCKATNKGTWDCSQKAAVLTSIPAKKPTVPEATITTIQKPKNWDCKATNKGTWDCSHLATSPVQKSTNKITEPILAAEKPDEPANWNCVANDKGVWDCAQNNTVASYVTPVQTPAIITPSHTRDENDAIFNQMVSHLAVNPWNTCEAPVKSTQDNRSSLEHARNKANVDIQADYAELINQNNALFTGDVAIKRADQFLTADQVDYKNKSGDVKASGDIFYQEKGFALYSHQAQLQLQQNTGQFTNNQFIIEPSHARGTSKTTHILNKGVTNFSEVTYSTCEPGQTDWQLEAETMELNNETGRGVARNVWLEFQDIPFLYTPYISFPIDDRRQSGFLAPTIGSSDTTGFDFSIPYYWNIAPNYDATITPRIMSDRGIMLGGEFRYLTKKTEGQIKAEVLEDSDLNTTRGQFSFQNNTQFSNRLTSLIDLNYLSDDDYLDDFGDSLSIASSRYIKSSAQINYRGDDWNVLALTDNYDSIDRSISSTTRPHRRLPQLLFTLNPIDALGAGKFDLRSEFTYFDHSSRTKAKRFDIRPGISFPYRTPGSFITPRVSLRHTEYRLDNQTAGVSDNQSRTLPILSVDSGLFFERDLQLGNGFIQTLEPRAFFLYVPHESQNDIPLFDTSEYDFSFNQLFRDNRFSGADRVADANQLTLAVTSRFLESSTSKERLRASIGSIFYFEDLDVTLNSTSTPITKSSSDVVAELSTHLTDHWSARSAIQYDPHASKTQKATLGLHYRNGNNKLFNATYRSRFEATTDDIEQTDLSFKWPLSKTWSSVGRWNYSTEHNLTLESFLGVEKDTCCWRFRVIARRYVNDAFDEKPKQGFFFQLELKGLSSFGEKLDSFLEEGILGYQITND